MRLQFVSDLHLRPREVMADTLPDVGADVLILAGDLANGLSSSLLWAERQAQALRIPTLWIAGNHEYYGETWPADINELRRDIATGTDLRLLECEEVRLGNTRILATTLWTDFLLFGPSMVEKARSAARGIHDYRGSIKAVDGQDLRPLDTQRACFTACAWLDKTLSKPWSGHTVVVTHHAPHPRAAHPHYNDHVTAAFVSDLRSLIVRHHIDAWISGHTHFNHRFTDLGTRFMSNQRGYAGETLPGHAFDPGRVLDLAGSAEEDV